MARSLSKKRRFHVLARCGFRCTYCGRSPKVDGVSLVVDHVVAVANGGSSDDDNLTAACEDCNAGKADMGCYACCRFDCPAESDPDHVGPCPEVVAFFAARAAADGDGN